jgi:hypothetical protein
MNRMTDQELMAVSNWPTPRLLLIPGRFARWHESLPNQAVVGAYLTTAITRGVSS